MAAGLLGTGSASAQEAADPAAPAFRSVMRPLGLPKRVATWDLNLEGALGHSFADDGGLTGFGRVRGGVLSLDANDLSAPMFALGFFADGSNLATEVAYGVQGEVDFNNLGLWFQLGAGVDTAPRPMAMAAAGWAILGLEAQGRFDSDDGLYPALFAKLRIPIGVGAAVGRYGPKPGRNTGVVR